MDKIAIMNKARLKYHNQHELLVRQKAREIFKRYKNNPIFIGGILLYWAEGRKHEPKSRNTQFSLINSDPDLLKFHCDFVRKYFNPQKERLRAELFLYPDLNENNLKRFWSQKLDIPRNQFIKSTILDSRSKMTKKKLSRGTCCVYLNNKDMYITMETWIEGFRAKRG